MHADDRAFMHTARDDLQPVAGFDLISDENALSADDAGDASDLPAQRRWRQMTQVDLHTNRSFIGFEERIKRLPSGLLKQSDQTRRRQDLRHAVCGKVNNVFHANSELELVRSAGRGFAFMVNPGDSLGSRVRWPRVPGRPFGW